MHTLLKGALAVAIALSTLEAQAQNADLILLNGKVFTAEPGQALQQAVAVADGKVLRVGSNDEIRALGDAASKVVDLGGKVVMPGFIDSHSHSIFGGLELISASMQDEQLELDAFVQRLGQDRDSGKARVGDIVVMNGMNSTYWSQADGLAKRLNRGEWANLPVVLIGSDHHTAWANAAMLKRAGLDAKRVRGLSELEQRNVAHDKDFNPTGFVVDSGFDLVAAAMPAADAKTMDRAGVAAVKYNNSLGITAWMDPAANGSPGDALFNIKPTEKTVGVLPVYRDLAREGQLTAHVAALLVANPKSRPADLDTLDKVRQQFQGIPNLTLPGIKVFADGVIEYPAQSAALLENYKNSHKPGELLIDPKHFGELVSAADARGWLVHIHAIGDRAVRESLNGIAQARKDRQSGIAHSITHLQLVNPQDFPRFRQLGVIASMQLDWATAEAYTVELVKPYIADDAYRYMYPAKSLLNNGAEIAGASDWPVSTPDPLKAVYQAVTRQGQEGVLIPEERVDRQTMFYAYTRNAAQAIGLGQKIGSLAPGKQADLVVLDRDVFTVPDQELAEARVLRTLFEGREVYRADDVPAL
ncbi:amidohydrolase [Pseudomonas sp. ZM23]|uniref:Amidohydrolase n=1 Tax=Pseudomonas triclosanedens TaxID=2961893 RepID=A0ABY7A1N1_9PSED|nr:amidohydrolase [Pseudomonas triclosanedens]MCP8464448.1 amidohydrolase [Pseudomonas triclosanedens]MCP8471582.1 amidohydrolase [Pseudomonas triclosanedens]MCP8477606.1 amidohydrolase [Pseudomonas triclosanedens]WAI51066.1 amidohydrolase [Pseudomonas triclosanedens]